MINPKYRHLRAIKDQKFNQWRGLNFSNDAFETIRYYTLLVKSKSELILFFVNYE
jgi:hypothetical protein